MELITTAQANRQRAPAQVARTLLCKRLMRSGIGLLLVGLAIVGFVLHQRRENPPTSSPPAAAAPIKAIAPPRPVSEHNWPKSALDRAAEVKRQVTEKRREENR